MNANIFCHKLHFFLNTFDVFDKKIKNFFEKIKVYHLDSQAKKGPLRAPRQIRNCPKSLAPPLERRIFEWPYEITQTVYGFIEKSSSENNFTLR